jgi:hypothetical protein
MPAPNFALLVSPANQRKKRVDPRGLEPLSSAMRGRGNSLLEVAGACKTPANKGILMMLLFSVFQEIYSGCCTVAARTLRLLHPHKVRDDHYLASCLEAAYVSFALGNSVNFALTEFYKVRHGFIVDSSLPYSVCAGYRRRRHRNERSMRRGGPQAPDSAGGNLTWRRIKQVGYLVRL